MVEIDKQYLCRLSICDIRANDFSLYNENYWQINTTVILFAFTWNAFDIVSGVI